MHRCVCKSGDVKLSLIWANLLMSKSDSVKQNACFSKNILTLTQFKSLLQNQPDSQYQVSDVDEKMVRRNRHGFALLETPRNQVVYLRKENHGCNTTLTRVVLPCVRV